MLFEKHSVSCSLQDTVVYFWTLKSEQHESSDAAFRFVPDGFVDWVFHLETPWKFRFAGQSEIRESNAHVFGHASRYIDLQLPEQPLSLFGIKFHPWAAHHIWGDDMFRFTDCFVELADIGQVAIRFLQEQIHTARNTQQRILIAEQFLLEMTDSHPDSRHSPPSFVDSNVGKRRLQQLFKNEIGISPKLFHRTLKINAIIKKMCNAPDEQLTVLAHHFDYFDQSHFIRDFRHFTNMSPRKFLKSINPSGDILNLRVKCS